MAEGFDPAFHFRVVVGGVTIKIARFKGILLQGGALKKCGNIGFYKNSSLENAQALKTLDK